MRACILILGLMIALAPSVRAADSPADSAKAFVQSFYDWYLDLARDPQGAVASDVALSRKPGQFGHALAQALKQDLAAQAKSADEVVGLDFDPFLNAQEYCNSYRAGAVKQSGESYQVEVFGSCPDDGKPDVIAEVVKKGDGWMFVNFIYPEQGDLLSLLKQFQKERNAHTQ